MRVPSLAICLVILLSPWCLADDDPTPQAIKELAGLLELKTGEVLADIGAGDGEWSIAFADWLGPAGHVFATEVEEEEIEKIRERISGSGTPNVTSVLGDDTDSGLTSKCCDGILLRLVYHHFSDPETMRPELFRVLRPGRRIALIDFYPKWQDHGVKAEDVITDMQDIGFAFLQRIDGWDEDDDRFLLLFRKPEEPTNQR